jgi:lysine N6-hydroxylase
MSKKIMDLVGIGIGPFNLSVAALLSEIPGVEAAFFDGKPRFEWHPGLMFQKARMQTHFMKDLVSAVRPTSPHSFVNYLVQSGRFYQFLSSPRESVGRQEFSAYMAWVAAQLESLHFGNDVTAVHFVGDHFLVHHRKGVTHARHVSIGTGRVPQIPECARPVLGDRCFHAIDILSRMPNMAGARVGIVGGGQTGAEIFLHALRGFWGEPSELRWISRRMNFQPLDETPFTNELFMPGYVRMFHGLDERRRRALVAEQKLAGDGISASTLHEIHDELYDRHFDGGLYGVELLPAREVAAVQRSGRDLRLTTRSCIDGSIEHAELDLVILCTGFSDELPSCIAPLRGRLRLDDSGRPYLGSHFDLQWDGPAENRIYGLNMGRYTHGIAEPQLSLAAWRSAVVINHLLGRPHFDVDASGAFVRWGHAEAPRKHAVGA